MEGKTQLVLAVVAGLVLALMLGGCRVLELVDVDEDGGVLDTGESEPSLTAVADTYVDETAVYINAGDKPWAVVRNSVGFSNGWEMQMLVAFDYQEHLVTSAGGPVSSATLRLHYRSFNDDDPAGRILTAHRIEQSWDEATVDWSTRPSFNALASDSDTVPMAAGSWMEWDVTADVNADLQMMAPCHGWMIRDPEPWGDANIPMIYFDTHEVGANAPQLIIGE